MHPLRFAAVLSFAAAGLAAGQPQYAYVKVAIPDAPATIWQMAEDPAGALWIASEQGLYRFDGARMRRYPVGTDSQIVRGVAAMADGSIWAAGQAGLFHYAGGKMDKVSGVNTGSVAVSGSTVAIVQNALEQQTTSAPFLLLIGRRQGDGGTWRFEKASTAVNGYAAFDGAGNVLAPCAKDLCEVEQGDLSKLRRISLPGADEGYATALRDRQGCLWLRNAYTAAYRCPGESRFRRILDSTRENDPSLFEDRSGRVWIADSLGTLTYGRPGDLRTVTRDNDLPRGLETVFETRDGSIWLGGANGLYRWAQAGRLEYWTERQGMIPAMAVLRLASGEVYAAGEGLVKLNRRSGRWERFGDRPTYQDALHLIASPSGGLLLALYRDMIAELDRNGRTLRAPPGIRYSGARLAMEGRDRVWIAGAQLMIASLTPGGRFGVQDSAFPSPSQIGLDLQRDAEGRLWQCSEQGLARQEREKGFDNWRIWTVKDGLLENGCRAFAIGPSGDAWYGYNQTDAFSQLRFDRDGKASATHFRKNDGFGAANYLDFDRRGWLWRGAETHYVSDGRNRGKDGWVALGPAEGFAAQPANQQGFYEDPDGSVWLASGDTLAHFTPPSDLFTAKLAPTLFLAGAPGSEVPEGRAVRFEFGSLYYQFRSQLRYRYWLHSNEGWTISSESSTDFRDLAPVDYEFELAARVLPGGDWTSPVSHRFRVTAPFWRGAGGLGALGLTGVLGVTLAWAGGRRRRKLYYQQKQAFLDALEKDSSATTDPDVERRLLRLSKIPTHLPNPSPWAGKRGDAGGGEVPREIGGRFEVAGLVAAGGFATVYRASDAERNGEPCAVKVFHLAEQEREWMLNRFRQEIESLKRIEHPHVVRFLATGETGRGEPYLAMEFVEGETLRARLAGGALDREFAASITLHLGSALSAIHRASVFHRDIKPENLMLAGDGKLVVIDFSIAIARDPRATQHALSRAAGSFSYMAPEQVFGYASPATDIYSYALVVFEMLTGKRAGDLGLGAASGSLSAEVVKSLATLCPDLPAANVLAEALEVEVRNRPQDALDFAERLAEWIRS